MPMRWDTNSEFKLLLKILESNPNITCNADRVAENWGGNEEPPTPRAVRERFNLIKKRVNAGGPAVRTPARVIKREQGTAPSTKTSKTPFKDSLLACKRTSSSTKSNKAPSRRRRGRQASVDEFDNDYESAEDDEEEIKDEGAIFIKDENNVESIIHVNETPSKIRNSTPRRSVGSKSKSITTYLIDDDQGEDDDMTVQNGRAGDADDEEDMDFDPRAFRAEENGSTTNGAKVARWRQALADLANEEVEY